MRKVYAHADYIAVNISSPNTVRLRELQAPDGLQSILGRAARGAGRAGQGPPRRVPLLVKVSPDLDSVQIAALAAAVSSWASMASSRPTPRPTWRARSGLARGASRRA